MRLKPSWGNAALLGLAVAGLGLNCSALAQNTTYPAGYGVQAYTPKDFRLPEGAGCSGDIARWQAVQANDYASGNVNLKIYNQIQGEIGRAAALCSAGRDGEARKLIASSKARHGYPQ
jgi:hypothetical protein